MATIFVDIDATGVNNGSSWGNAFTDLQSALAVAGNRDQIWVAEGTYLPTTDGDREISFVIPGGVEIYGGFAGNEVFLEQRDFEENITILSGNIGSEFAGDNSYHVVDISSTSANTILDGLTISDGRADGTGSNQTYGGGLFGENANAIIKNLTIDNNSAEYGGGLYLQDGSSVNVISTTFTDNSASMDGGAVYFSNSLRPNIVNSLFLSNEAQNGGAIYNATYRGSNDTELGIANNTFVNNVAGNGNSLFIYKFREDQEFVANNIFWNTNGRDNQIITAGPNGFGGLSPVSDNVNLNNNIILGGYELVEGENNTTEDPLFFDPDNNDFRLQLGSPGIDGGNNDFNNFDTDILGNTRIFNDTIDIGAYEYGLFLSIDDATVVETENDGANLEFTVNLVESLGQIATEEIAVNYTVIEDTAIAGSDYAGETNGIVIFSPGQTEQIISVPILDDDLIEQPELLSVELSNVTGNASIVDDSAVGIIQDDDINKTIQLFRLRNNNFSSGTFLYAGAAERDAIINDPNSNFSVDGVNPDGTINPAFTASVVPGDDLLPFFRLESLVNSGTFLFVSTGEYNAIFAEGSPQSNQWRRQGFDAAGQDVPEFYLLSGSSETGTAFNRFQNLQNGTFLYAGPEETIGINSNPSLSSIFVDQGVAFKSLV